MSAAQGKKSWYAWVVFGAAFFMIFTSLGFGSSTKGTFLGAITGSLGLARSKFTIGDSLRYITTAVMSLFFGRTVEKLGLRLMALLGFIFLILAFVLQGFAPDVTAALTSLVPESAEGLRDFLRYLPFYAAGILLGAGFAWSSTTLGSVLVRNWFAQGQGTVTGIVLAANGLGGLASEFVVTKLIYGADGKLSYMESHWQAASFVIAAIFAVVGFLVWLLIRDKPEDVGQEPLSLRNVKDKKKVRADWEGMTAKEAFRRPWFYLTAVGFFMIGFCVQSMSNIAKPYLYDLGYDKNFLITVFAVHTVILAFGKALTGVGNDTVGIKLTYLLGIGASIIAFLSLFFLPLPGSGQFGEVLFPWTYGIFSSFGLPLETVMVSLLTAYLFGRKDYPRLMGYFLALVTLGCALGVPLVNLAYDIQGTYKWMTLVLAVMTIAAGIIHELVMWYVNRKYREPALREESSAE